MIKSKLFIANWKMHKTTKDAIEFVRGLNPSNGKIIIAPPFTLLETLKNELGSKQVAIAAQNFYYEDDGAYTGEISASMLLDLNVSYVLIGHSERRHLFNESNEDINKKIKKALKVGLIPILCIGETLDERNNHETEEVLKLQLEECLQDVSPEYIEKIIVAYEPIWAIGSGLVATSEQAEKVHAFIRKWIKDHRSQKASEVLPILYGGSVKPDNIKSLLACADIDGVLVGGASLDVITFNKIINS